ncbi:MAG: hypothetical protein HZB55_07510 [Deltaproteobacteria bacterium]|nr:hypothetical protein [Deltaproteobacteria bacterium]
MSGPYLKYPAATAALSHTIHPKAPELCRAKLDELKAICLEAFTKKYDPYWDIPLNENLPKPVIELPGMEESGVGSQTGFRSQESGVRNVKGRRAPMGAFLNPDSRILRGPNSASYRPTPVRSSSSLRL